MVRPATPPTHGAATSYRLAQGVRHRVRQCRCWFPFGVPMQALSKNREEGGVFVGVYIVMVCRWTDHILARNPLLEVEADLS